MPIEVSLERARDEGVVFIVKMNQGDNRFTASLVKALLKVLETVSESALVQPTALITIGLDKFYSNGLDLDGILRDESYAEEVLNSMDQIFLKMYELPCPTIAAMNGHAFAAGFMFALAHDYRIMRDDRGFLCLNEVDMKLPFRPAMSAVISSKLAGNTLRKAVLEGHRFSSKDALECGIIESAVPSGRLLHPDIAGDEVLHSALMLAHRLKKKASPAYGLLRVSMFEQTVKTLRDLVSPSKL